MQPLGITRDVAISHCGAAPLFNYSPTFGNHQGSTSKLRTDLIFLSNHMGGHLLPMYQPHLGFICSIELLIVYYG